MIDLNSAESRRNPYPLYAQLRAAAPVLRDPRSGLWLLLDYESVKRALTDHATFASDVSLSGRGTLGWMIFTDPPRHTKLRALVTRAFTPRAVAALEPRVREIARGELPADVDEELAIDLLSAPAFYRYLFTGGPVDERLMTDVVAVVLRGLAPPPSSRVPHPQPPATGGREP